jgi:transcriptional regulator with XRE-family HTH domain
MIFSQNVAKLQRESGLNNTQLAGYLGVSRSTVSRILSNRRGSNLAYTPAYRTVRAVADKLKLTSDDVFKYRVEFHEI